jgi:hypothetical protein
MSKQVKQFKLLIDMLIEGMSPEQAKSILDLSDREFDQLVALMMKVDSITENRRQQLVVIENQRLDRLWQSMFQFTQDLPDKLNKQSFDMVASAVDKCLKIQERRAKLLGLDSTVFPDNELRDIKDMTTVDLLQMANRLQGIDLIVKDQVKH